MKTKTIDSFSGEYDFLSNFYPSVIYPDHIQYPTVEHAYQAQKTLDPIARELIRNCETPGQAKRLGNKVLLREDWEQIKVYTMHQLLEMKFSIPELGKKLLETGNAELIEGNNWGDTFWGMSNGKGSNALGGCLEIVRGELQIGIKLDNKHWMTTGLENKKK
jgi:ribA/ribD-fused uncharacterized protein